jgi:hypothetical protein
MSKVKAPKGCVSFSWGGTEFSTNGKRIAEVPPEAVAELVSHGFVSLEETKEATESDEPEESLPGANEQQPSA